MRKQPRGQRLPCGLAVGADRFGGAPEPFVQAWLVISFGACPACEFRQLPPLRLHNAVADEALLHALKLLGAVCMPQVYSSQHSPVLAPQHGCHAQHPSAQLAFRDAHLQQNRGSHNGQIPLQEPTKMSCSGRVSQQCRVCS